MSDQAVKIFEALSDVDEELLERCNQETNRESTAAYKLFWRYGKAMAACVCLIVVGAAAWSGYRLITGPCGANSSGSGQSDASPIALSDMGHSIITDEEAVNGYGEAESEGGMPGNGMEPAFGTAGNAGDGIGEDAGTAGDGSGMNVGMSGNGAEPYAGMNKDLAASIERESAILDSAQEISWEEACVTKPFDSYLPSVLPAGYVPFSARKNNPDLWNRMIFKWSNGERILCLNMLLGEVMTKEEIERRDGLNEYFAEDFRKELIPEPLDGRISFTLYYGDGMQIVFDGYITADEMWEVVESISK